MRADLDRRLLAVFLLTIIVVGVGAAFVLLRPGGDRLPSDGVPPTTPEELRLLESVEQGLRDGTLQPDPYSEDLLEVLAALPVEQRWMADHPWERQRLLMARATAMTRSNMTGDPDEVEPFLAYLESPPPPPGYSHGELGGELSREAEADKWGRMASVWGLLKLSVSDAEYGAGVYERAAAALRPHTTFEPRWTVEIGAAAALHYLRERGRIEKRPEDEALIQRVREKPENEPQWEYHMNFEKEFEQGDPL